MKIIIIITMIAVFILNGCVSTRARSRANQDYTPAQSELVGALIGAGIGIGLGCALNTGIDEKWQNYGSSTYSSRWTDKPIGHGKNKRGNGRKGGYSAKSGYNNVSRFTTKNRKGNNMIGMALQLSQIGANFGRQIGIENELQKLQEENELLKKQIN